MPLALLRSFTQLLVNEGFRRKSAEIGTLSRCFSGNDGAKALETHEKPAQGQGSPGFRAKPERGASGKALTAAGRATRGFQAKAAAAAVKDLPPIDSLTKDSDFTPFFAQNVPDFLKRQAYRVLWRSNPIFNFRDGLDDYDEDFSLSRLVGKIVSEGASKPGQARANDETAKTAAPEKGVDADNKRTADADAEAEDDDVGDGEDGEETAEGDESKRKKPRKSDVRPPDDAV